MGGSSWCILSCCIVQLSLTSLLRCFTFLSVHCAVFVVIMESGENVHQEYSLWVGPPIVHTFFPGRDLFLPEESVVSFLTVLSFLLPVSIFLTLFLRVLSL